MLKTLTLGVSLLTLATSLLLVSSVFQRWCRLWKEFRPFNRAEHLNIALNQCVIKYIGYVN